MNFKCSGANKPGKGFPVPGMLMLILLLLLAAPALQAETGEGDEQLSVSLNVKGIGSVEIPAIYRGQDIYLSVTDIFNFLKVKNTYSEALDSISGFLVSEDATFLIETGLNRVTYRDQVFQLQQEDMIRSDGKLFLRGMYFGSVFGLECTFNFRNLAVMLNTDLELPAIREMRQELMRSNINKLNGEEKADSIIGRNYPAAAFGMVDWSIVNSHNTRGLTDTRLSLGLGSIMAGGETNLVFNYDSRMPLSARQQYYLWRHVNNDRKALRQVLAGKVRPQFTSSVYNPAVGIQLTNEPTTFRRSFGTYTLSNTTKPGWIVELYVNNVLVSYVKADASGFYTFQVPLVYGNSTIKLRFYGPYGEERALEEFVNIPFNFLPARQFEYNVSAGIIEDAYHSYQTMTAFGDSVVINRVPGRQNSHFTRAKFNYGFNRFVTVGGGVEYLSSVTSGPVMPFVNTSIRLAPLLLLTGEYTMDVVAKGLLTYRRPSNLQFELGYARYDKDQTAILHEYREQRKAVVSYPFRGKNFSAYSRLSLDQIILENTQYTNTELMLSGAVGNVSTNLSTYALIMEKADPLVYSNLALGFRLPMHIVITPQVQFEYTNSEFISGKLTIEKRVMGFGLVSGYYEENIQNGFQSIGIGLRLDLSFAQAGMMAVKSNYTTTFTESANGSFVLNQPQKSIYSNNRSSIGKGGLVIAPFLDLNYNGLRDADEPRAAGMKLVVNGGRIENNLRDTVTQVFDLEPYTTYYIKIQPQSFENISWSVKHKSVSVIADPNHMKLVEIPVTVASEVSGMVYMNKDNRLHAQGKITVLIYDEDSVVAAKTMTEQDGYFSLYSLKPGRYRACIDPHQLINIGMNAEPAEAAFTIHSTEEGDIIDNLKFVLTEKE